MAETGKREYNATKVVSEAVVSDAFKEHLFDAEEISLADISAAFLDSGLVEDLNEHNMEFNLGYRYLLINGIPTPPHELNVNLEELMNDFNSRLESLEKGR